MLFLKLCSSVLVLASLTGVSLASPLDHDNPDGQIAPLYVPPAPAYDLLNNSYVVILKDDISPSAFAAHLNFVSLVREVSPLVQSEDEDHAGGVDVSEHVYDSVIAKGYAGKFSRDAVDMIRRRPEVQFVEQDQVVYGDVIQQNAPWGLARVSHKTLGRMQYVYPPNSGAGVVVYVIDSGVNVQHTEFEGRAHLGKTFIPAEGHRDLYGHGTHVAGTIASRKYGVAKKAEIISVKVLDKQNRGTGSNILAGLQWAVKDAKARTRQRGAGRKGAVINMSLGGGHSPAEDKAVNNAVRAGFHVVVAAGNDHKDACLHSPASASLPITVGSTTREDKLAASSNHGKCVDILAPGDKVVSAGNTGPKAERIMSGTSMATPHVAGLIAHFLSIYPSKTFNPHTVGEEEGGFSVSPFDFVGELEPEFVSDVLQDSFFSSDEHEFHSLARTITPLKMKTALKQMAWRGLIHNLPRATPNLLAFNNYTSYRRFDLWDEDEDVLDFD